MGHFVSFSRERQKNDRKASIEDEGKQEGERETGGRGKINYRPETEDTVKS